MTYHFGSNEYYHLVGRVLINESGVCRVIQGLQEEHDSVYRFTDGIYGNAYMVYLIIAGSTEMESFHFRNFVEVIKKYGELQPEKPRSLLTVRSNRHCPDSPPPILHSNTDENAKHPNLKIKKWTKIYPEE
jgi:hypothetical protein